MYFAVPPDINSEMTSSDVTVNEGSNATLTCKAFGLPRPEIKWRREDGREFVVWERRGIKRKGWCSQCDRCFYLRPLNVIHLFLVYEHHGEYLHLSRVRRQDMGAFMVRYIIKFTIFRDQPKGPSADRPYDYVCI